MGSSIFFLFVRYYSGDEIKQYQIDGSIYDGYTQNIKPKGKKPFRKTSAQMV
jgi:hypothetical protein